MLIKFACCKWRSWYILKKWNGKYEFEFEIKLESIDGGSERMWENEENGFQYAQFAFTIHNKLMNRIICNLFTVYTCIFIDMPFICLKNL